RHHDHGRRSWTLLEPWMARGRGLRRHSDQRSALGVWIRPQRTASRPVSETLGNAGQITTGVRARHDVSTLNSTVILVHSLARPAMDGVSRASEDPDPMNRNG